MYFFRKPNNGGVLNHDITNESVHLSDDIHQ